MPTPLNVFAEVAARNADIDPQDRVAVLRFYQHTLPSLPKAQQEAVLVELLQRDGEPPQKWVESDYGDPVPTPRLDESQPANIDDLDDTDPLVALGSWPEQGSTKISQWIESASTYEFRTWLRSIIWSPNLHVTEGMLQLDFLVDYFGRYSPPSLLKIHQVLPDLLREWREQDPSAALEVILALCRTVRCAMVEPDLINILKDRLSNRPDKNHLRKQCLELLCDLGCTERSEPIFRQYLVKPPYTEICYRALYRFNPKYAVSELPALIALDNSSAWQAELRTLIRQLFREYQNQNLISIAEIFLKDPPLEYLEGILNLLPADMFRFILPSLPWDLTEAVGIEYNEASRWRTLGRIITHHLSIERLQALITFDQKQSIQFDPLAELEQREAA